MLELFFPSRIKDNVIASKNVLNIYISGNKLYVCLTTVSGKRRIIKRYASAKIILDNTADANNAESLIAQNLSSILKWKWDFARVIITGGNAIFKFLEFPFDDIEKIKMVTPFELEPMLPFSISECSIDSIKLVDKVNKNEKIPTVSAVIKQETIDNLREITEQAHVSMQNLSLDVIEVICHHMKKEWESDHALIISGDSSLALIVYVSGSLVALKSFEVVSDILKKQHEPDKGPDSSDEGNEEKKDDKKDGAEDDKKGASSKDNKDESAVPAPINNEIKEKVEEIAKGKAAAGNQSQHGSSASIEESLVSNIIGILKKHRIESDNFQLYIIGELTTSGRFSKITQLSKFKLDQYPISFDENISFEFKDDSFQKDLPNNDILLIASSFYENSTNFNLAYEEGENYSKKRISRSVLVAFTIGIFTILVMISWNFFQTHEIKKDISGSENETLAYLKKEFDLSPKHARNLDKAIKESESSVSLLEANLPFLVTENRYEFLRIFETISGFISHDAKGLKIGSISWKNKPYENDWFSIDGIVANFESLQLIEDGLRKTGLFLNVPQAQDLRFSFNLMIQKGGLK
jgi:hypothetical protein